MTNHSNYPNNPVLKADFIDVSNTQSIHWETFDNKTFLITGATGFIGSILTKYLIYRNESFSANIKLILPVRSIKKAQTILPQHDSITYIESDLESLPEIPQPLDYVIHCASPTKSKYFIENPVETLDTILLGTKHLLEVVAPHQPQKILYLSSMEAYGTLENDNVKEENQGYINPLDTRSSYSLGKRTAELYCYNYFTEFNLPIVIARLAMCFGSGILASENRVYKAFIDAGIEKHPIEVKSSGKTHINFLYTSDALKGLFLLLDKGVSGEAYNLSSMPTTMNILDMAHYLATKFSVPVLHNPPKVNLGFAPDNHMSLSLEKISSLGFKPSYSLESALNHTIDYLNAQSN